MDSSPNLIKDYSDKNKQICYCTVVSILLIFLFILSPLSKILLVSFFGKTAILVLLGFTVLYNWSSTKQIQQNYNISLGDGSEWTSFKTNLVCSYVFTVFLAVLFIVVFRSIFV